MQNKPLDEWTETDWEQAFKEQAIQEAMKPATKFNFAEVVVVEDSLIGAIVKSWDRKSEGNYYYEVYVRSLNQIVEYHETQIKKFIWNKELSDEDIKCYN
jgi:hypothetical protein